MRYKNNILTKTNGAKSILRSIINQNITNPQQLKEMLTIALKRIDDAENFIELE